MTVPSSSTPVIIYTDGSCHTQCRTGAWVAILFIGSEKKLLTGLAFNTTHHRMELTAVIEAIAYVQTNHPVLTTLTVYSDSQYVVGLANRQGKDMLAGVTKKGNDLPNADLVKALLALSQSYIIEWVKVKAHQKTSDIINYNREADLLSRKMVRQAVKENFT